MKLLQITGDTYPVFEALADEAGVFSDNGGEPDGPAWLADVESFSGETLAAAIATGEAEIVIGTQARYAAKPMAEIMDQFLRSEWCGYGADGIGFFLDRKDAEFSELVFSEYESDDDLDTIAYRVCNIDE